MNWEGTQPEEQPASQGPAKYSRRTAILSAAALACSVMFVESNTQANTLEITRHKTPLANLDRPVRIVQLTDLHRSQFVLEPFIARVVEQTNRLAPDIILLTGDFVTRTSDYAESCMRQLAALRAPLGKYAVLGNHDYWCDGGNGGPVIADWLEQTEIELLTNRSTKLLNGIRLVGVDDLLAGVVSYPLSFADVQPNEPLVVMSHNPGTFNMISRYDGLIIAGHTHGGQIYVPGISNRLIGSKFLRGWYHRKDRPGRMYISRGLGTIHVPMRLCCAPEIAVFDLAPG